MRILVVSNLYPTPSRPASGTFVRAQVEALGRLDDLDVDFFRIERSHQGRRAYARLRGDVLRRVADTAPDLVHVMYGGVMADVVTRAVTDRPVVVTFYGTDLFGLPRSAPLARRLSARYGVRASHRAAARASSVVVQSRGLAAALPASVPPSRVHVLPDGVDFDVFRPLDRAACRRELGWSEGRRYVLFPSAPARPEKRYELAEAAVRRLVERGAAVELQALDGVQSENVVTWLNAADVVLLTSRHEGSPNVVKEALACDVAVVSVDVGDVRERLAGIEGCYIAAADAEDLAVKLELVLTRPGRIDARERSADVSLARTSEALREIYYGLIRG